MLSDRFRDLLTIRHALLTQISLMRDRSYDPWEYENVLEKVQKEIDETQYIEKEV